MAPAKSDDEKWATADLTSTLAAHVVFQRHNMVLPPRILPDNVERAIQILDQHDPSTAKADAEDLKPIDYAEYTIKDDLRPMAHAAGMHNLHHSGIKKGDLVGLLTRWDIQNFPLMAALLPRPDKATKPAIPKQVVSTRKKAETEPAESKKRKAVPTKVTASKKPRNDANAPPGDHNVATKDRSEPGGGDSLPQTAIEGSTSTRTPAQARTRLRKPRNGQSLAAETYLEADRGMAALSLREFGEDKGNSTDDALTHNREGDDKRLETKAGEVQVPASERHSTRGRASGRGKGSKKKTEEQIAEEEERKMHNARRLGRYSDPVVAETFRVLHKTVLVPMHGKMQEGVEPVPTDQLGMRELRERLLDEARRKDAK